MLSTHLHFFVKLDHFPRKRGEKKTSETTYSRRLGLSFPIFPDFPAPVKQLWQEVEIGHQGSLPRSANLPGKDEENSPVVSFLLDGCWVQTTIWAAQLQIPNISSSQVL